MKTQPIILAVLMLAAVGQVHADSATIDVTGKVLPGTCTVANVPVVLDEIDATDLKAGHDNGLKLAVLEFINCVGVSSIDLTFDGTDDPDQDNQWKNLAAANAATGVAVTLLEGTTGDVYLLKGAKKTIAVNGAATGRFDMRTGYYRTAGTLLKAGDVSTQITVTAGYR